MKDDHKYNALIHDEDHNGSTHFSSSTVVDDVEQAGQVGSMKSRRGQERKTFWERVKSWRWVIEVGLLFVVLGLLAEKQWGSEERSQLFELAGDITGFAPRFSQKIVSFERDARFAPNYPLDWWTNETQQAWLDIVPGTYKSLNLGPPYVVQLNILLTSTRITDGLGYLEVQTPSEYSHLPHPIHDYSNTTVYTTSLTHQLHCLYTITSAYNTLQPAVSDPSSSYSPGSPPIHMPCHINHCFDYLRQAVMCAGDVALEGVSTTFPRGKNGEDRGGSDGWDARHVCKAYGEVYRYLEERTVDRVGWIASVDIDDE
jgi:hypothetical protein